MSTKIIEEKLDILTQKVNALQSLLFSLISDKDPEGEYRDDFIMEVTRASKDKSKNKFTNSRDFLKILKTK